MEGGISIGDEQGSLISLPISTKELDQDHECPICLTSMNTCGKDIVILQCCKNKMHLSCYMECINVSKSCPFCRRTIQQQFNSLQETPQQHIIAIMPDNELLQRNAQNYSEAYRRKVHIFFCSMMFMSFAYYIAGRVLSN